MSLKLNSPFLGIQTGSSLNGKISNRRCFGFNRGKLHKRVIRKRVFAENQNDWIAQAISVKEPFAGSRALVRSLSPLWNEGYCWLDALFLLLFVCCVFTGWYGQKKAKAFVEAELLPSVCSVLSEHIQREVDFGKVRSVSPLSITLEACSIGPHSEEFSCGEVPSMKIHVRPFASLRRGKIVIDAVLSHPSLLIAQKKDYTWLGLPFSEDVLQRHLSTEEGIDFRTKSRRIAREESAARWERERDDDARKAAEMGYIVSVGISDRSEDGTVKEKGPSVEMTSLKSFSCLDEKMHQRDHHCVDTNVDYDMKHAELEKSFGVKIPGSGLSLWPKVIEGLKGNKFKKKLNGRDTSCSSVASKRRILERSASAAIAYFHGLSLEDSCDHSEAARSYDLSDLNAHLLKNGDDSIADISGGEGSLLTYSQFGEQYEEKENRHINDNATVANFNFLRDPFLMTVERLSGVRKIGKNSAYDGNAAGAAKTRNSKVDGEDLGYDNVNRNMDDNVSKGERSHTSTFTSIKSDPTPSAYHSVTFWPLDLKFNLPSFPDNMGEWFSNFLAESLQKINYGLAPKFEDVVAELVDGVNVVQTKGIEKMLPVTVDSVHFKSGTLMLLAFGDREPRCKLHS
ncbi:Detected protein of confused Function [Hibiscus syriacus]|uniref:Detected protein of confused Function n=1 Tax=Hibiscus syriacus TaxID=106335 RepID=A0A6A2WI82_HIBSY|nr:Detected protein of confused Function [Hibiscus syriacus]